MINDTGQVVATLKTGSYFGEVAVLGIGMSQKRTANVRARGFADIFVLDRESLHDTLEDFPHAKVLMQQRANKILIKDGTNMVRTEDGTYVEVDDSSGKPMPLEKNPSVVNLRDFKEPSAALAAAAGAAAAAAKGEGERGGPTSTWNGTMLGTTMGMLEREPSLRDHIADVDVDGLDNISIAPSLEKPRTSAASSSAHGSVQTLLSRRSVQSQYRSSHQGSTASLLRSAATGHPAGGTQPSIPGGAAAFMASASQSRGKNSINTYSDASSPATARSSQSSETSRSMADFRSLVASGKSMGVSHGPSPGRSRRQSETENALDPYSRKTSRVRKPSTRSFQSHWGSRGTLGSQANLVAGGGRVFGSTKSVFVADSQNPALGSMVSIFVPQPTPVAPSTLEAVSRAARGGVWGEKLLDLVGELPDGVTQKEVMNKIVSMLGQRRMMALARSVSRPGSPASRPSSGKQARARRNEASAVAPGSAQLDIDFGAHPDTVNSPATIRRLPSRLGQGAVSPPSMGAQQPKTGPLDTGDVRASSARHVLDTLNLDSPKVRRRSFESRGRQRNPQSTAPGKPGGRSVCLPVCLSIFVSVCPCVCLPFCAYIGSTKFTDVAAPL